MAKKTAQTQPQTEFDLLSETQHRAAHLISCGVTYRTVADRLGINPCTLSEWQKNPAFRAKVNELLLDAQESTKRRLVSAAAIALDTLLEICRKPEASDRDRIAAANSIMALVAPQPMQPGAITAEEIEEKDREEALWAELTKMS